jgi:hypothetical protein
LLKVTQAFLQAIEDSHRGGLRRDLWYVEVVTHIGVDAARACQAASE